MASMQRCPVCTRECLVAKDGKSGFCFGPLTIWKGDFKPKNFGLPPVRHKTLPPIALQISSWMYEKVGHYLSPTLEQWELGLMRYPDYVQGIVNWMGVCFGWRTYHRRKGLPLGTPEQEKAILCRILALLLHDPVEEQELLSIYLILPDDAEAPRLDKEGRWIPPDHLEWSW